MIIILQFLLLQSILEIAKGGYIFVSLSKTWSDANSYCESTHGTELATIIDSNDNSEAYSLLSGNAAWIGLNDLNTEGTWEWVDGISSVTYTNWASGEPNNVYSSVYGERQHCADIESGRPALWDDDWCSALKPFLCNKYSTNNPTPLPSNIPTNLPSNIPSNIPSNLPSNIPSNVPSNLPSFDPSNMPSNIPTNQPSNIPTNEPSNIPTNLPTKYPSQVPTDFPLESSSGEISGQPTEEPTEVPYDV